MYSDSRAQNLSFMELFLSSVYSKEKVDYEDFLKCH